MGYKRLFLLLNSCFISLVLVGQIKPNYDLHFDKVLYTVGYGHLDTQWGWTYKHVINVCLPNTLRENFYLFKHYPDYVFSFTGARRYRMIKEYYPDMYQTMKRYIGSGQWALSGSSVDEAEVNISSPESVIRQVLYGNKYFQDEFGRSTVDYMLPDCFGFVVTLPTVLNHCGIKGFITQKLGWGGAVPIPFNVGVWKGLDDKGVIAVLNAPSYTSHVEERLDLSDYWNNRLEENRKKTGFGFDFKFYGVGDMGGAPMPNCVRHAQNSLNHPDAKFKVLLTSSEQIFKDVTPDIERKLPTYKGDLLLTEHSAGSMTSVAYMKRMNRKNENLAYSSELAGVMAESLTGIPYPLKKLYESWQLLLGSQMHDILPGTASPQAYELSYNDEMIAQNGFYESLKGSLSGIASQMDTDVENIPLVVYNPMAYHREDIVEVKLKTDEYPNGVSVFDRTGKELPTQIVSKKDGNFTFVFLASVPSMGLAVYDLKKTPVQKKYSTSLKVTDTVVENANYKIELSSTGDIAQIYDKKNNKALLSDAVSLDFLHEHPNQWPSWNMDWKDRKNDPIGKMDNNVKVRVVEKGPVRAAVEIVKDGFGSSIKQMIYLVDSPIAGQRIEVDNELNWRSRSSSLKASFPLFVENDSASFSLGIGAQRQATNHTKLYEFPMKGWMDLTDMDETYGVSVLEDCKYGADKPNRNTLRLTLAYTPGMNDSTHYQATQDWAVHKFKYGIYGHKGSWQKGRTQYHSDCMNKPLVAFITNKHKGLLGKSFSFMQVNNPNISIMTVKKSDYDDTYIIRINENSGGDQKNVRLKLSSVIAEAYEVDGQERRINDVEFSSNEIKTSISHNSIRSFAVRLTKSESKNLRQHPIKLPFNDDNFTFDFNMYDASKINMPAELMSDTIVSEGIRFVMGNRDDEVKNSVRCKGQVIDLPSGEKRRVYLLAASSESLLPSCKKENANFVVGKDTVSLNIAGWQGFYGNFYKPVYKNGVNKLMGIEDPFLHTDNIAWFASHTHFWFPSGNIPYNYCYIYKYEFDLPDGVMSLILPKNDKINIFSATIVENSVDKIEVVTSLIDTFDKKMNTNMLK